MAGRGRSRGLVGSAAVAVAVASALTVVGALGTASGATAFDWRSDWAVLPGFSVGIDTQGYRLPTAIAFVPDPGPKPDDPLYFVTELRGRVRVVSNDRTVHTFFTVDTVKPRAEYPDSAGDGGLAGICLDPARGYVFVTFTYVDRGGVLRNDIARLSSDPGTFSLRAGRHVDFADVFAPYQSAPSHQIGGCRVKDDELFAGIGDGEDPNAAGKLDSLVGKVMCMTVDGGTCPDGPFAGQHRTPAADYTWAYGFRNPFGIDVVGQDVFVGDNGNEIDRFLRVRKGEYHYWDGGDGSIATGSDVVFTPGFAPVQLEHYPTGSTLFPTGYADHFFIAAAGPHRGTSARPGVATLGYDLADKKVSTVWSYFVKYRGTPRQEVIGLAFGPDGLYLAPILPNRSGTSAVLKVRYDANSRYPFHIGEDEGGLSLMQQKGCFGCHQREGQGGTVGPSLDRESLKGRLEERLFSSAYSAQVARVDRLREKPFTSYTEARRQVLAIGDDNARTALWVKLRLLEPKFDDPLAQMPDLGLTEKEAVTIRDYLLGGGSTRPKRSFLDRAWRAKKWTALGFAGGVALTVVLGAGWGLVARRRASR